MIAHGRGPVQFDRPGFSAGSPALRPQLIDIVRSRPTRFRCNGSLVCYSSLTVCIRFSL
jgi:hypothetical protein